MNNYSFFRTDSLQKTLKYDRDLSQTVLFQDDSENLFIGGINYVLQVDINDGHIVEVIICFINYITFYLNKNRLYLCFSVISSISLHLKNKEY